MTDQGFTVDNATAAEKEEAERGYYAGWDNVPIPLSASIPFAVGWGMGRFSERQWREEAERKAKEQAVALPPRSGLQLVWPPQQEE